MQSNNITSVMHISIKTNFSAFFFENYHQSVKIDKNSDIQSVKIPKYGDCAIIDFA